MTPFQSEGSDAPEVYVGDTVRGEWDPNGDGGRVIGITLLSPDDEVTIVEISVQEARELIAGLGAVIR